MNETPRSYEYPVVHVWQQLMWHCDGYIIGNREGLSNLKDAIEDALKNNQSKSQVFSSDGEGYDIKIICTEETEHLAVTYTDEIAQEKSEHAIFPWDM
jgi:hypothetical protein